MKPHSHCAPKENTVPSEVGVGVSCNANKRTRVESQILSRSEQSKSQTAKQVFNSLNDEEPKKLIKRTKISPKPLSQLVKTRESLPNIGDFRFAKVHGFCEWPAISHILRKIVPGLTSSTQMKCNYEIYSIQQNEQKNDYFEKICFKI